MNEKTEIAVMMTKDEYILTLISIIISYTITIYLDGWANIIKGFLAPKFKKIIFTQKTHLWILISWSLLGFGISIQFWLAFYDSIVINSQNTFILLSTIGYVMLMYGIVITIFPSELRQKKVIINELSNERGFKIKNHVTATKPVLYFIVLVYLLYASAYTFFFSTPNSPFYHNSFVLVIRIPAIIVIILQLFRVYKFNKKNIETLDKWAIFIFFITLIAFIIIRNFPELIAKLSF